MAVYRDSTEMPYGKVGVDEDREPSLPGSPREVDILAVHSAGGVLEVRSGGESLKHFAPDEKRGSAGPRDLERARR